MTGNFKILAKALNASYRLYSVFLKSSELLKLWFMFVDNLLITALPMQLVLYEDT